MKTTPLLALALALGCAASTDDSAPGADGADGTSDGADGATDGADGASDGTDGTADGADGTGAALNGDVPDAPVAAPEFTAANRDGSSRSREDLLGQPTVMWFYPLAASAG